MVILSLVNYRSYVFIFSQVIFAIFLYKLRLERRIGKVESVFHVDMGPREWKQKQKRAQVKKTETSEFEMTPWIQLNERFFIT